MRDIIIETIGPPAAFSAAVGLLAYVWVADPPMRAVDGDTVRMGQESIRLKGYDAPETYRAGCDAEHEIGMRAKQRLAALVRDRSARISRQGRDRYGRTLATLTVGGVDVADIMISEGLAVRYTCDLGRCPPRIDWCARLGAERRT